MYFSSLKELEFHPFPSSLFNSNRYNIDIFSQFAFKIKSRSVGDFLIARRVALGLILFRLTIFFSFRSFYASLCLCSSECCSCVSFHLFPFQRLDWQALFVFKKHVHHFVFFVINIIVCVVHVIVCVCLVLMEKRVAKKRWITKHKQTTKTTIQNREKHAEEETNGNPTVNGRCGMRKKLN